MKRIEKTFAERRAKGGAALVAYLTAGDPSLEETQELVLTADRAGADIIEVGVPFSDPTADGPILQAAFRRALNRGVTLTAIIDMIAELRKRTEIPIVLFGYYNPIFRMGEERFAAAAADAGADGILVVDLPHEEAAALRRHAFHEVLHALTWPLFDEVEAAIRRVPEVGVRRELLARSLDARENVVYELERKIGPLAFPQLPWSEP